MITLYDIKKFIYKFKPNIFKMLGNQLLDFEDKYKYYVQLKRYEYMNRLITYFCSCGAPPIYITFDGLNEWATSDLSIPCSECNAEIAIKKEDWINFMKAKKAYSKRHLTQTFPPVPFIESNYRADILDTVEIPYTEPEEWWPEPVKEIFRKNNAKCKH